MRRSRRRIAFAAVALLALSLATVASVAGPVRAGEEELARVAPSARDPRIPPRKRKKLFKWLVEEKYKELYVAEPEVHDSLGPHGGNVRTYYNPILVDDLAAGKTVWSKGAAMVKELYTNSTEDVRGYAVMIKVANETGPNGEGWLFYETFDPTGASAYYGRGLGLCANCHSAGTDLLLSAFRP